MGKGNRTPDDALNLAQEVQALRKKIKTLERENKRLTEENELLADASAFFAASRRKSARTTE
jgi:transposase